MTVSELRALLADLPGDLEVVLQADNYDDGRTAVDAATCIAVEDRSDGPKLYIIGGD
jgi:hypothetical protein